jgi:choline dehydrogenase-like flavoprotein
VTTIDTDLCVVGTGAAGITIARELSGSSIKVLLVEAGGRAPTPEAEDQCRVEATGLPIGADSRQRLLGGTTNTWWGKLATLDPIDLQLRAWVPRSGWPFDRATLEPYYRRAARVLDLPALAGRDGDDLAPLRGPALDGDEVRPTHFAWQRPPLNFADVHRRDVGPAANVTTLLEAQVTAVELDADGEAVETLTVRRPDGDHLSVRPRSVVLACGGIENARLLLASRARRPAGVGNEHDQVGRNFMDHPKGQCGEVIITSEARELLDRSYWRSQRTHGLRVQRGVGLTEAAQERLGALNSYLLLEPVYEAKDRSGVVALRRLYRHRGRGLRWADVRAVAGDVPALAGAAGFRLLNRGRLRRLRIHNFLEQAPDPANRVTLSEQRDSLGLPRARLAWTVTDLDRHSARALHGALDREVHRRAIGYVDSPLLAGGEEWTITQDASHHVGTTRMGDDPRSSVVDANARVHSVANLYVAGSSVFPTSGYANPTFTIVALSLRLADHLRTVL